MNKETNLPRFFSKKRLKNIVKTWDNFDTLIKNNTPLSDNPDDWNFIEDDMNYIIRHYYDDNRCEMYIYTKIETKETYIHKYVNLITADRDYNISIDELRKLI